MGVEQELISQGRASLRQLVATWSGQLASSPGQKAASIGPFVELLSSLRSELRAAKNWRAADEIRDSLAALGIILEDGPGQTTWRME